MAADCGFLESRLAESAWEGACLKLNRELTLLGLWLVISRHGAPKAGTSSLKPPAREGRQLQRASSYECYLDVSRAGLNVLALLGTPCSTS